MARDTKKFLCLWLVACDALSTSLLELELLDMQDTIKREVREVGTKIDEEDTFNLPRS